MDEVAKVAAEEVAAFRAAEQQKTSISLNANQERERLALQSVASLNAVFAKHSETLGKTYENPSKGIAQYIADQRKAADATTKQIQDIKNSQKQLEQFKMGAVGLIEDSQVMGGNKSFRRKLRNDITNLAMSDRIDTAELSKILDKVQQQSG